MFDGKIAWWPVPTIVQPQPYLDPDMPKTFADQVLNVVYSEIWKNFTDYSYSS